MLSKKEFEFFLILSVLVMVMSTSCLPDTKTPEEDPIRIPTPELTSTNVAEVIDEVQLSQITPTSQPALIQPEEEEEASENDEVLAENSSISDEVDGIRISASNDYRAVFVEEDDVLNIRNGPGIEYEIVVGIPPNADGISVTGQGQVLLESLWLPVQYEDESGWVNSRYLVQEVSKVEFCEDEGIKELISMAYQALTSHDGDQLSDLVSEGRSLRVRRYWWDPEVLIEKEGVENLFNSEQSYYWGTADGSGDPIEGSFSEVIVPLLDRNLMDYSESSCDEILHGGTAGLVQIPPSYDGINYYSFYRAAGPDDFELDWGTWILGIEIWQGNPYLSYLVHYEWEI